MVRSLDEDGYRFPVSSMPLPAEPRKASPEQRMLFMAAAPLLDGVFASAVVTGVLATASGSGLLATFAFGLGTFSGAACVEAAFELSGSLRQQLKFVLAIYFGVVLPGIALTLIGLAKFQVQVEPELRILVALVLVALALDMIGIDIVPSSPPLAVLVLIGSWWILTQLFLPLLLPHLPPSTTSPIDVNQAVIGSGVAFIAGLGETLLAVVLRPKLEPKIDHTWLRRAAAASIGLIVFLELGYAIPGVVVVGTFLTLTSIGILLKEISHETSR